MAGPYYLVGTGNWSGSSTTWATSSGGVASAITPTATDDCWIDANSGTHTLTVAGTSGSPDLCQNLVIRNPSAVTITMGSTAVLNISASMGTGGSGAMTGLTWAPNATSVINFVSTSAGNTILHSGYAYGQMTYNGVGGAWTWQDANSQAAVKTLTLTNGTLSTGNFNTTNAVIFSSNNSNTRALTLGTSTWTLSNSTATVWDIGTSTGMTLSAASSTLSFAGTTVVPTINTGGLTYGTFSCTTLTTGNVIFTGAATWGTMTCSVAGTTKTITSGYTFPGGVTTTITGTFTSAGNSLLLRNFLRSSSRASAATLSAGTFTITNTDLRDITHAGSGSGTISTTSASTGNGDAGGNTGWTFQAPRNVYMKTAVSVNWSAANWFTTSGGSTAATPPLPLCHDTAIFDVNSVTAGSKTITNDQPRVAGFTWAGVANTPAFASGSVAWEVYGSAILVSGMTHTGTGLTWLCGSGSLSLDGGTLTWPTGTSIEINCGSGTYSLAQSLTIASAGGFLNSSGHSGTFNLNGFNITWSGVLSTVFDGGTITGTGTVTNGTGVFTISGGTVTGGAILSLGSGGISVTSGTLTSTAGAITTTGSYAQSGGINTLGGTMTIGTTFVVSGGTLDMNAHSITGLTTVAISGSGLLNLSGQLTASSTITVSGGTVANTGALGELKTTGNSLISFSGGTSSPMKITEGGTSSIQVSSGGVLNIPAGGSMSWKSGSFQLSGATGTFTTGGRIVMSNNATVNTLSVVAEPSVLGEL